MLSFSVVEQIQRDVLAQRLGGEAINGLVQFEMILASASYQQRRDRDPFLAKIGNGRILAQDIVRRPLAR